MSILDKLGHLAGKAENSIDRFLFPSVQTSPANDRLNQFLLSSGAQTKAQQNPQVQNLTVNGVQVYQRPQQRNLLDMINRATGMGQSLDQADDYMTVPRVDNTTSLPIYLRRR